MAAAVVTVDGGCPFDHSAAEEMGDQIANMKKTGYTIKSGAFWCFLSFTFIWTTLYSLLSFFPCSVNTSICCTIFDTSFTGSVLITALAGASTICTLKRIEDTFRIKLSPMTYSHFDLFTLRSVRSRRARIRWWRTSTCSGQISIKPKKNQQKQRTWCLRLGWICIEHARKRQHVRRGRLYCAVLPFSMATIRRWWIRKQLCHIRARRSWRWKWSAIVGLMRVRH